MTWAVILIMDPKDKTSEPDTQKQSRKISSSVNDEESGHLFANNTSKPQSRLPPWLDHFNKKDLKILFKTSLAVWITTIFIFIKPTLDFIGQATFFAG